MRIHASGLTKEFGGRKAVDGLSFTVEPGRVTGFVGTFHPRRSARDHLRILAAAGRSPAGARGRVPDRRVDQVLDQVGLAGVSGRPAGGFSLGMGQRLAAALLGEPRALLLDEPANGLDPHGVAWLRELLRAFAAEGGTVLVSSHLLAEMQLLADHVVVIGRGRLLAAAALAGTAGALLTSAASFALLLVLTRWDGHLFADPRLWRSLAFGAGTVGLVAAMAAGLGALTRGTGLPVVLLALWGGFLEPLVAAVLGGGAGLLPFLSMLQLAAYSGDALGLGAAGPLSAVVFPLCLAAVLAASAVVFARRDATTT